MRWALIALFLWGCADLETVERLRCGNGLQELQANEDCDGRPLDGRYACGEPGTDGACRYVCEETVCPPGWDCGRDGICRAGAGRFETPWAAPIEGRFMNLGDLDADGHPDLVALSSAVLSVAYGDAAGTFGDIRERRLAISELPPAVGDLDDDGRADVLVYTDDGLRVFKGREDRQLVSVATQTNAPSGTPIMAFGVKTAAPYESQRLFAVWQDGDTVDYRVGTQSAVLGDFDFRGTPNTLNRTAVGDLDGGGTADEIALHERRGRTVYISRVECAGDCVLSTVDQLNVPVDGGLVGTIFADVDGDGRLDLIALLAGANDRSLAVSYQDADGVLGPLAVVDALDAVAGVAEANPNMRSETVKVAVDLMGDARAEYVTGRGIWALNEDGSVLRQVYASNRPMVTVAPADLDGDGAMDLVVRKADSLEFLVFEDDEISLSTIAMANGSALAVADFDGDGADDVVIEQTTAGIAEITFAGAATEAEDLQPFAFFERTPEQLVAIQPSDPDAELVSPAQLFALGRNQRFRFDGSTSDLPTTRLDVERLGRDAAIGYFVDGLPAAVASGYGSGASFTRYLLPGAELGTAAPSVLNDPCAQSTRAPALSRAVDVDGDGVDELLTLTSGVSTVSPDEDSDLPVFRDMLAARIKTWSIHRARIDGDTAECLWTGQVDSSPVPVRLEILDFDGDGVDDIVALMLFRREGREDLREPGPSALAVWRGDGTGHGSSEVFELPVPMMGATAMKLAAGASRLVLADTDRVWTAHLEGDELVLDAVGAGPNGVQALRTADVDADGLEDLIIKNATTVFVARQRECTARDVWEGRCLRGLADEGP